MHAPKKIRIADCQRLKIDTALPHGAIVGKAEIYGVKEYKTKKEWLSDRKHHFADCEFSGNRYGFLLKKAKRFTVPIPYKGALGFFDVGLKGSKVRDDDITSEIFDEEYRTQWINHH